MAARGGRRRAGRVARQLRWWVADGALPVAGGEPLDDRAARAQGGGGRPRPAARRPLCVGRLASRPARGAHGVDGPVGHRRARPGRHRLRPRHVRRPPRPAVQGRLHRPLPRRADRAEPPDHRVVPRGARSLGLVRTHRSALRGAPNLGRPALRRRRDRSLEENRAAVLRGRSPASEQQRLRHRSGEHPAHLVVDVEPRRLTVQRGEAPSDDHAAGTGGAGRLGHRCLPERCERDLQRARVERQADPDARGRSLLPQSRRLLATTSRMPSPRGSQTR